MFFGFILVLTKRLSFQSYLSFDARYAWLCVGFVKRHLYNVCRPRMLSKFTIEMVKQWDGKHELIHIRFSAFRCRRANFEIYINFVRGSNCRNDDLRFIFCGIENCTYFVIYEKKNVLFHYFLLSIQVFCLSEYSMSNRLTVNGAA